MTRAQAALELLRHIYNESDRWNDEIEVILEMPESELERMDREIDELMEATKGQEPA